MARPHAETFEIRPHRRPPGRDGLQCLVVIVTLLAGGTVATAQHESADEALLPRAERGHFASLANDLDLTDGQEMVVDLIFDDYLAMRAETVAEIDARAELAGRQSVLDALAGRTRVDPEQLRMMQAAVLGEYRRGIPVAVEQLDMMLDGVRSMLTDEQLRRFGAAERTMRRHVILQPRTAMRLSYDYAGDGVDVIQLLREADRAGGELEGVSTENLTDLVTAYELQMDALLVETVTAELEGQLDRRIARLEGDADAAAAAQRDALQRWRRLYTLNRQIVDRIGAMLGESAGASARQRWLDRFDEACFPRLFERSLVDRRYDWIVRQEIADRATVDAAYHGYLASRRALASDAIRLMLRARQDRGIVLHSMSDPTALAGPVEQQIYQQLLRISGQRSQLDREAAEAIAEPLDDEQRTRMRRAVG